MRPRTRIWRPQFDILEDRLTPSTFVVENLADAGDGSLRAAILAAEANPGADVIRFAGQVRGTITLTTGELDVRSDLAMRPDVRRDDRDPCSHRLDESRRQPLGQGGHDELVQHEVEMEPGAARRSPDSWC